MAHWDSYTLGKVEEKEILCHVHSLETPKLRPSLKNSVLGLTYVWKKSSGREEKNIFFKAGSEIYATVLKFYWHTEVYIVMHHWIP